MWPALRSGTMIHALTKLLQLLCYLLIQLHRAVEILGAASGPAAACTGTGTGTRAAAGAGTVSAAATETAAAKPAAPASAAKAATAAAGRAGPRLGAHAAGTGLAVRPGRVPEMVDEHIPGTEAAGVAVAQLPEDPHHRPNEEDGDDQRQEQGSHACVLVLVSVVPAVIRRVNGAVVRGQDGGPVGVDGVDAHGLAVAQVGGGDSHHAGLGRGGAAGVRCSG